MFKRFLPTFGLSMLLPFHGTILHAQTSITRLDPIVVIEENKSYDQIMKCPGASYIPTLMRMGASFTHSSDTQPTNIIHWENYNTSFRPDLQKHTLLGQPLDEFASGPGLYLITGLSVGLPFLQGGGSGYNQGLRTAEALLLTGGLVDILKNITHELRPDRSDHQSFPSGHAALSFAAATMRSSFHPPETAYWYTAATIIAISRVDLRKHFIHDIVAGATLGYLIGRLEIQQRRGIIPIFYYTRRSSVRSLQPIPGLLLKMHDLEAQPALPTIHKGFGLQVTIHFH